MRAAENPFATHRLESLALALDGVSIDSLCEQIASRGSRYCILGEHGSGKTLLLDSLRIAIERRGTVCRRFSLEHGERLDTAIRTALKAAALRDTYFFIDGADSISAAQWFALRYRLRHARGILVTSHTRVLYPVLHTMKMSSELFEMLVESLVDRSALDLDLRALLSSKRGNAREAFLALYDHVSHRQTLVSARNDFTPAILV